MGILYIKKHDYILQAVINRPGAMNSVNFEVMEKLEEILDQLEQDHSIRTFILSGSGKKVFISGGDLKEFHGIKTGKEAKAMARRMLTLLERIEKLPCWTIASVNGAAYGGGCETMLAFDFRIASLEATFGFTQGRFYLPPGWGGLTRLVERVGRSTALRWLGEAAVIDAGTALKYKLIDRTAPPDSLHEEVLDWAEKLAKNDRDYIRILKEGSLNFARSRWEAIEAELEPFSKFWEDERHHRRVKEFLDGKDNPS